MSSLFRKSERTQRFLDENDSAIGAERRAKLVEEALASIELAGRISEASGLFSANEEDVDEISTSSLKYFLIPYLHGELLLQSTQKNSEEPSAGLLRMRKAREMYREFLRRLRQYRQNPFRSVAMECLSLALMSIDEDFIEAREDSRSSLRCTTSTLGGADAACTRGTAGCSLLADAGTKRRIKIEKYKLDKSIREKLRSMEQKYRFSINDCDGGDDIINETEEEDDGTDEEAVAREMWVLRIESAILQAYDRLEMLDREYEMLSMSASMPSHGSSAYADRTSDSSSNLEVLKMLQQAASNLKLNSAMDPNVARNFSSLHLDREHIRRGVFAPSHRLPTISVEEAGEMELRDMIADHGRDATARDREETEARERRDAESVEEIEYREIMKARAWDDWKDENPRGWGNRAVQNTR